MKVNGRVTFMALKDAIEAELAAGAFAKRIHSKYKDQLGFSYTQFLRYMQQYELHNPLEQCHASRRVNAGVCSCAAVARRSASLVRSRA